MQLVKQKYPTPIIFRIIQLLFVKGSKPSILIEHLNAFLRSIYNCLQEESHHLGPFTSSWTSKCVSLYLEIQAHHTIEIFAFFVYHGICPKWSCQCQQMKERNHLKTKKQKTKNKKRKTKGKLLDIAIRQAIKVGTKGIRVYKKGVTSSRCGP